MKKVMFLLSFVFISFTAFSQTNWRINKISGTIGWEQDMPFGLSSQSMIRSAKNFGNRELANTKFAKEYVTDMVCENYHHRIEISLTNPKMENTEFRIGLSGVFNRGESISYNIENSDFQYLNMHTWTNEMALEGTFLKYHEPARWFRMYGGLGMNIGASFGGYMNVDYKKQNPNSGAGGNLQEVGGTESQSDSEYLYYDEYYDLKNGLHNRLFVQGGIMFRIRRVEFGPELRYGLGYRKFLGAPVQWTQLRSYAFALRITIGEYEWPPKKKRILARHYF